VQHQTVACAQAAPHTWGAALRNLAVILPTEVRDAVSAALGTKCASASARARALDATRAAPFAQLVRAKENDVNTYPDRKTDGHAVHGSDRATRSVSRRAPAAHGGCPFSRMRSGFDGPETARDLPDDLLETHAATQRLLENFTLSDVELCRQLHVQLQRLERAVARRVDSTGTTHYLAGVCFFQLQQYSDSVSHLEIACAAQPEQHAWTLMLERARASSINGVALRRAPTEAFRAEHLTYPAALQLRAPDGIVLPPGPSLSEQLVDKARTVAGVILGPPVVGLIRAVGSAGSQKVWRLEEKLANVVLHKPRTSIRHELQALVADMMLAYLRMEMNRDTLQDPYPGDLVGHAPPGQRRPEWTRYFPTADGSWRTDDPNMGRAGTRFPHQGLSPASDVARNRAEDSSLPNPRQVSRALLAPEGSRKLTPFLNMIAAAWIQFQVHGWFNHRQLPPERGMLRYPLDEHDPIRLATGQTHLEFRKTQPDVLADRGPEYFQNETTHWWDASQVYGSDQATEDRLRTGPNGALLPDGKLYLDADGNLPIDPELGVEDTGFSRNWWIALSFMHGLFAREHNHVCDLLKAEHPTWSSDHLFKAARLEVAAKMARIHTVEWTPAILPNRVLASGLNANWNGFISTKFQPFEKRRANAWWTPKDSMLGGIIGSHTNTYGKPRQFSENFSEVYRLHSAVPDTLEIRTREGTSDGEVPVELTRDRAAHELVKKLGLETLAISLGHQHMPMLVENNYPAFMFNTSTDGLAMTDIAAADIVRARERGVPAYNQFRAQLGRPRCHDYSDITKDPKKIAKLESVYGAVGIEKVDLQVGLLFEDGEQRPFQGFDDTRFAVFLQEASRRLEADPFFTERWNDPRVYTREMKARITEITMKSLLLHHLPGLARSGLAGVNNAFEPWGTTVHTAPEEHPLSASEEWYANTPSRHAGST